MINITLATPQKLNNNILVKTSAFVSFDYDARIVEYIKNMSTRVYIPEIHTWEMPAMNIIGLCNHFEDMEIEIKGTYKDENTEINIEIPKGYKFKTNPFKHQLDGVRFGLKMNKFLLCDDQGLGKTKQIIDLAGCLAEQDKTFKRVLIVCGVNSLKYNWVNEISTHSNEKSWVLGTRVRKNGKTYEGSSKDKMYDLNNLPNCKYIITNIESMRIGAEKVNKTKYVFEFADKIKSLCDAREISMIALDESHKCKNPTSIQGRAMLQTSARYMVAMSGTPLMNNPLDLYFSIKWLGYEQHSFYSFKQHYCTFGGWGGTEVTGFKNLEEIRQLLDTVMLRRLKMEVLDLPEKMHQTEYVDMSTKQSIIYKEVLNNIKSDMMNKISFSNNPLSMLIRLRQATGWTGIVSDKIGESAKMDRMVELVEELAEAGQKCIVFSNWSQITEIALQKLKSYHPAYITGDTKADDRMNEVNRFQNDDKCKVIVGTIGSMGTGLTLTSAQTVIFLDEPWNRALKDQAEDRAHRIGTKGTVNIITLICKDTIDERISDIVYKKGLISDMLVDGKAGKVDMHIINQLLN